jgi:membrane protease YdiL (CAAX protease family)
MTQNARWRLILLLGLLIVRFGCYELLGYNSFITQISFVIATYVLAYLFFKFVPRQDFLKYNMTWLSRKAVIVSISVGIVISLIDFSIVALHSIVTLHKECVVTDPIGIAIRLPWLFLIKFTLQALPEEFLFRGILWGEGRNIKLSNFSILCIQSILFWGAHYYYYDMPYNWICVIVAGLIFGIVAWKTKSILASTIVHAIYNAHADLYRIL